MRSMPTAAAEDEAIGRLTVAVARFRISTRKLRRLHAAMERALASAAPIGAADRRAYAQAVREYFANFQREAQAHLRDVDRRLDHTRQVQFNLTAERGVLEARIAATDSVLHIASKVESGPRA